MSLDLLQARVPGCKQVSRRPQLATSQDAHRARHAASDSQLGAQRAAAAFHATRMPTAYAMRARKDDPASTVRAGRTDGVVHVGAVRLHMWLASQVIQRVVKTHACALRTSISLVSRGRHFGSLGVARIGRSLAAKRSHGLRPSRGVAWRTARNCGADAQAHARISAASLRLAALAAVRCAHVDGALVVACTAHRQLGMDDCDASTGADSGSSSSKM